MLVEPACRVVQDITVYLASGNDHLDRVAVGGFFEDEVDEEVREGSPESLQSLEKRGLAMHSQMIDWRGLLG